MSKQKPFDKNKKGPARPKGGKGQKTRPSKVDKQFRNPDAAIRLNKYIANSGVCSRRDADIYIKSGNVKVNGEVITEMGHKVKLDDEVKFDGRRISPERKEYVVLNKPKGFYVTGNPEKNNRTVMDLVIKASPSRLSPIGKLDSSTMGLLLFTNDGTLSKNLGSPKQGIRQIYEVQLTKKMDEGDLDQLQKGVYLKNDLVRVKEADYVQNRPKNHIGIELNSLKPHIVQKLFKKLGYEIDKLDRVVYGGLTKKDLPRGRYRHLTKQEVINLGMIR
jgi:23S rRNA pseudouridine2605 synthase